MNTLIELKDIMQRSLKIVFTLEIKLLLNYSALMILEDRKLVNVFIYHREMEEGMAKVEGGDWLLRNREGEDEAETCMIFS